MSLGWYDLRRTTRRRGPDAPAQVYPFLLRDDRLYPQLALAVEYFESMVGRPRAELDGEVLVQFFADHRLARGIVASLAGHYQYRRQGFADALDATTRTRLAEQGIHTPADLRATLYDDVNRHDGGFAAGAARAGAIGRLAARLELASDVVEALLVLDAEDRAPLVRLGSPPTAAEVAAIYNHLVADAVLRAAARVDLELARPPSHGGRHHGAPGSAGFARALSGHAALAGLRAEHMTGGLAAGSWGTALAVHEATSTGGGASDGARARGGDRLVLLGEQDAMGSWTRHGRRLARALGRALVRYPTALRGATTLIDARGGPYACALGPEFLRAFVGPTSAPGSQGNALDDETGWGTLTFWDPRPEMALLRRRGEAAGWSLRNWPAALVYPEGVLFPDFALVGSAGPIFVIVVDAPALAATIAGLASRLAARQDVLLVATAAAAPQVTAAAVATVVLSEPPATLLPAERGARQSAAPTAAFSPSGAVSLAEWPPTALVGPLAAVLEAAAALHPGAPTARLTPLDHLLEAVRDAGFLPPERALALAGCADEAELAGRLAAAGVEDVRLVSGVGLHTEAFLRRLHDARLPSAV